MNETLNILYAAKDEIRCLRRRNEILQAKVEVMDLFACVLHTTPARNDAPMGVDIEWEINKEVIRLLEEESKNTSSEAESTNQ